MADPMEKSRERVIDAMYKVVLDPDRYDPFIDAWTEHVAGVAAAAETVDPVDHGVEANANEAELQAHFDRARALMDRIGRQTDVPLLPLSQLTEFAVSFDADGQPVDASAAARLPTGDPVTLADLIGQIDDDSAERLHTAFREAATTRPERFLTLLHRTDTDGRNQTLAVIAKQGDASITVQALSIVWSERIEAVLSSVYGLSPAETAVMHDMMDGYSLAGIADLRGRSLHTVRSQLKSIFRKTRASTQSDVVRNVATIAQFVDRDRPLQTDEGFVKGEREHVNLPDGRIMHVDYHGLPTAKPVIFVHGMLDGTSVTPEIEALLYRHDLRLICPIRPGFDDVEAFKDKATAPKRFADDLSALLDMEGISKPIMVGHMSGAVFTYAAAHFLGPKIGGIVNVSGGVPLERLSQIHEMTSRQRTIAYTARFTPMLLPAVLRASVARIDRDTSSRVLHDLYPADSLDRHAAEEHALEDLLYDGYRFAVRNGTRGFEIDSYHVIRDWSELVHDCPVPAIHVHGTHDPVVTIKSVRRFCGRYDHARILEHNDSGQLVFYQKPSAVFDAICECRGLI